MADIRNFRKYLEDLSGNNLLTKKVAAIEKRNVKLSADVKELKEEIKLLKKFKNAPLPKKKGRKPRPMIRVIEDEMAKAENQTMKVVDIVAMVRKKKVKTKAINLYSSIASSLTNNDAFEKSGPGEFRLVAAKGAKPAKKTRKKKAKKAAK